jgi:N-acetylmuramic acid 6-phosphate etherase
MVGIIAGGNKAIHSAIEGAEDSIIDGINAIEDKDITENDVVIG